MGSWQSLSTFVLDQVFGYQTANKLKERDEALGGFGLGRSLGGSRSNSVQSASYVNVPDWKDVEIDGTNTGGLTVKALVEVRTLAAGTSVTPKIRNITDGSDAVVGSASTATNDDYSGTNQKQTLTFTPASGVKKYRLMIIGGNANAGIFGIGEIVARGA